MMKMNLPNKLATLRIILVIPFVIFLSLALEFSENTGIAIMLRIFSAAIFVGAAITDYYDGKIARKYDMITNLGKLLDPLADKILVISALVTLGKWKTATQMVALTLIILIPFSFTINNILLLIPLILTVVSGIEYIVKCKNILNK